MGILDIVRGVVGDELWAKAKPQGKHILLPCPECMQAGGDSKGDNLVVTPEKGVAKCFACGYTITTRHNTLLFKSRRALMESAAVLAYLEDRKVKEAAIKSGVVGAFTEEIAQHFGMKYEPAVVFWLTDGIKIRRFTGEPKYLMSPSCRGQFEIYNNATEWIVCEGEIDALTLFSVFGPQFNYIATGGASKQLLLPETVKVVYYFPDNDQAGEGAITKLLEQVSLRVVRVPSLYKDVNEWAQKDTVFKANLIEAFKNYESVLRPPEMIASKVEEMLERSKEKSRTRNRKVADYLLSEMLLRGKFILSEDGVLLYFYTPTRRLYPVHTKNSDFQALITQFGIYSNEQAFTYTVDMIQSKVKMDTLYSKTKIYHNAWFSWDKKELYIDLHEGEYLVLDGDKVKVKEYGDDEDVLFWGWGERRTYEQVNEDYLMRFLEMFHIKYEVQRKILYAWIMGVVFNGLFYSKPILVLESVAGSGKSTLAKMIGKVLINEDFDVSAVPENSDNFMAIVSKNSLIVFDNVERVGREMLDFIAMASTGATFQKRKLYHEFETVKARSVAWICFTMMNNTLRRKDIVERSVFVNLERLKKFLPMRTIFEKVSPEKIWGSIINTAQEILRYIRTKGFEPSNEITSKIRMSDFAVFLDIICQVKGWDIEEIASWWLKTSAIYSLADSVYLTVLLQALDEKAMWDRYWKASQILEAMHDVARSSSDITKTEKEIILALKPKSFWSWLENQIENLRMVGYDVDVMTEYTKKAKKVKFTKTEDAVEDLLLIGEISKEESNVQDDAPF